MCIICEIPNHNDLLNLELLNCSSFPLNVAKESYYKLLYESCLYSISTVILEYT
jgi:hypothetical protein